MSYPDPSRPHQPGPDQPGPSGQYPTPGPQDPMAPYPGGAPAETARESQPPAVRTAFLCWIGIVVVGVLGALLSVVLSDQVVDSAVNGAGGSAADRKMLEDTARASLYGSLVFGLVASVLYLWLAFVMRGGKNWARITLTVLGVLGILGSLFGALIGSKPLLLVAPGLIGVVLDVAAIYFMWRPEASRWFAAQKMPAYA